MGNKCSRYLKKQYKNIIDSVIKENILLAMLDDSLQHIRDLGIRRIIAARTKHNSSSSFEVPFFNFEVSKYTDNHTHILKSINHI